MAGQVYLVGAGCGKADLITVRGLTLLSRCEVVVYDDLIDPALLDTAPREAERIYMGKRSGRHSAPQSEICEMLVKKASEGKTVVRLKGGDPFVFGRGGEEMQSLLAAGIPCEAVPGISSALAIPAAAGIPVTHRGLSRSVHIVTAHTADTPDGLPHDLDTLAALSGTLVFLMGLAHLEQIARRLMQAGKPGDTPAAVISGGNAPHPATVRGTLDTIAQQSRAAGVQSPAVIVVGSTAALELSPTIRRPLQGLRIGLTGTDAITNKLSPALSELGAEVYTAQRAAVEQLSPDFDLRELSSSEPKWLVFTSSNGVRAFFALLHAQQTDLRSLAACRFAVIGAATGEVLAGYGVYADLCPDVFTGAELGRALAKSVQEDERVYLFRAEGASSELRDILAEKCRLSEIPLYALRRDGAASDFAAQMLPETDYLVFASAGGVNMFFDSFGGIPPKTRCVCIGDVTARALHPRCENEVLTAPDISADGIVRAICEDRR